MIFGVFNPEKIWHQQLVHLPTSPIYCSHFTFGNKKSHFQPYYSYILLIIRCYMSKENKLLLPYPPHLKKWCTMQLVTTHRFIQTFSLTGDGVSKMTYYVSSGTLNPTHSHSLTVGNRCNKTMESHGWDRGLMCSGVYIRTPTKPTFSATARPLTLYRYMALERKHSPWSCHCCRISLSTVCLRVGTAVRLWVEHVLPRRHKHASSTFDVYNRFVVYLDVMSLQNSSAHLSSRGWTIATLCWLHCQSQRLHHCVALSLRPRG